MKILVSNDDGYQSKGIQALVNALSDIAEITVVAPDRNRSGASNSLTLEHPLRVREIKENWYYVNGTPTDCVHVAVTGLLKELPDMIISGINESGNLGDDVLYSGTVAAAIEGRFLGLPSIAMSLVDDAVHYETAAIVAKKLVSSMHFSQLPPSTILNVNVPDLPLDQLGSLEVTRLGKRHAAQPSVVQTDPRGHRVYWMGLPGEEADAGPGTDFYAIKMGNVSITPLQLDWTHYQACEQLTKWTDVCNQEPMEFSGFPDKAGKL